jgi:exodeoxyribonuclease V alpha subunit
MPTELSGQIERITYTSEETGFTIAKVKVRGQRDLVTVVGKLLSPTPGEVLEMSGEWTRHPRFGEQFKVSGFKTKVPATVDGIKKYLGSGLIRGLGPVMAGRIVERFGRQTLEVIENQIERLVEVEGIGRKRILMIAGAWEDQKEIRDVMIFLQSYGVGSGYAAKIFTKYGKRAIAVVKKNPYRLATDIVGIGFLLADKIAGKIGFENDDPLRVSAGTLYVLQQLAGDGHVYYPYAPLMDRCRDILNIERGAIVDALGKLAIDQKIVIEDLNENIEGFKENHKAVYLTLFHRCETAIGKRLKRLVDTPKSIRSIDSVSAVEWVQKQLSITLAKNQIKAIRQAFDNKVSVITGGPGTGKTTIINAIIKILSKIDSELSPVELTAKKKARIMLAAPTGRAAKRMAEATGHSARTIHRLLEYSPQKGGFQRNEDKPIDCDVLIIDEASMIDTVLMHHLLKAVPAFASVILVGDIFQLPSVGAGNVLGDIIESGVIPVVALNEIFRQAKTSRIITNAHKINNGILPFFEKNNTFDPANDFYFIENDNPEKVLEIILELAKKRIPQRFGYGAFDDIQILTPMHKGLVGASNLNDRLQAVLNPGEGAVLRGERTFRIKDKVMQVRNNYDKDVFNGDIGRISAIRHEDHQVSISFDDREVNYDFSELDEIVLAYAISVHKSQGSEYPVVVFPILTQHFILLQRNLIYTAVTRGRNLVVMVGSRKALAIGVNNNKTQQRYTRLQYRLRAKENIQWRI